MRMKIKPKLANDLNDIVLFDGLANLELRCPIVHALKEYTPVLKKLPILNTTQVESLRITNPTISPSMTIRNSAIGFFTGFKYEDNKFIGNCTALKSSYNFYHYDFKLGTLHPGSIFVIYAYENGKAHMPY